MTKKSIYKNPKEISCTEGKIFKFIVENSSDGILILVKDKPVYVNNKIVTYTGYSEQELLSRPVTDYIHSDNEDLTIKPGSRLSSSASFKVQNKNGDILWANLHTTNIDWHGEKAALCFLTNITENKKHEQELSDYRNNLEDTVTQRTNELQKANKQLSMEFNKQESIESASRKSSDNYRSILDNIQDVFFEISLSGKLTFCNKALCNLSGYTADELINLHYSQYASEKTEKSLHNIFNKIFTTGDTGKILEYEMIRKDGSVGVLAISVSLIRDSSGKPVGFMGVGRDITARIEAEKELGRAKNELEKRVQERTAELIKANIDLINSKEIADKSAKAKTEFLANMSHEIRTPLNAIIGMSELLMNPNQLHKQKEYLKIVYSSSISLLELVNDILDYSKIDAGNNHIENIQFNLQEVIDEIADMFLEKNIYKELELIIDIKPEVPEQLSGYPLRLRQILSNLVSNAFKFTEKGEICITVETKSIIANTIELLFCIKDTGIGISEDLCNKNNNTLFEAFSQADGSTTRKYGGTGLGLAICKKIVTMMGGDIWVKSSLGNGSSFYFTSLFEFKGKSYSQKPKVPANIQNKTVLIVDDNPSTLMVIKRYMESFGFRTELVETAEDAMQKYETAIPAEPYSLILMDIRLPGLDGVSAAQKIKQNSRRTAPPIIVMSALGNENEINRARKAGVESFLMKPIKQSILFDTIMEVYGYDAIGSMENKKNEIPLDSFTSTNLLLVEDNTINQIVVLEMLRVSGINIDVANNGIEALDCIRANTYDAILMDVQMPEMDGLEATKTIRGKMNLKSIPIIAMTAHAMYGDREKCIAAGMNDYISKPIDRNKLFSLLKKYAIQKSNTPTKLIEEHSSDLSFSAPGLDIREALKRLGSTWKQYSQILVSFHDTFKNFSAELNHDISNKNFDAALLKTHSLKGTAGNISAKKLQDCAEKTEIALKEKITGKIIDTFSDLDKELKTVLNSIIKLSSHETTKNNDVSKEKKRADENCRLSEVLSHFSDLYKTMNRYDPVESNIIFNKIKTHFNTHPVFNRFSQIIQNLNKNISNYNFDEASEILKTLEKKLKTL